MSNSPEYRLANAAKFKEYRGRWLAKHPGYKSPSSLLPSHKVYKQEWAIKNREKGIFNGMLQRCNNPNSMNYHKYGAVGIKVRYCSFYEFLADVGPRPLGKYSIDRINSSGHYERGNCRWATVLEQRHNQKRTKGYLAENHYRPIKEK